MQDVQRHHEEDPAFDAATETGAPQAGEQVSDPGEAADVAQLFRLAHSQEDQPSASDIAFGGPQTGAVQAATGPTATDATDAIGTDATGTDTGQTTTTETGQTTTTGTGQTTTTGTGQTGTTGTGQTGTTGTATTGTVGPHKHQPSSSHNGGFTGFGAEFNPYSYTDPHENHHKLDPKVRKLGAQHVRMIIPGPVISTSLLGAAGPDFDRIGLDKAKAELAADPTNAELQKKVATREKQYAKDVSFVHSFMKTMELAGKHTTINLTYCGGEGQLNHVDIFATVVRHLIGQGYSKLQLTLENEPNGPDSGDGPRGHLNHGFKHEHDQGQAGVNARAEAKASAQLYVDEYARLNADLADTNKGNVRDRVSIVGGDMVGNRRTEFFKLITKLGLNKYVDAYSVHIYWGANKGLKSTLNQLLAIKKQADKIAPGKALQVTEFGKEHYSSKAEKKHNGGLNAEASEKGPKNAFEQALFALSAVNDGYTGVVKWDAFYGFKGKRGPEINPETGKLVGDPRGNYGHFSMIGAPGTDYATDASYRLMSMFTHATEPGWHVHGTNHGVAGAQAHFRSADGDGGAILAMSQSGGTVATTELPKHHRLYVTIWNGGGNGGLQTHVVAAGEHPQIHIPTGGAVAISTKPH